MISRPLGRPRDSATPARPRAFVPSSTRGPVAASRSVATVPSRPSSEFPARQKSPISATYFSPTSSRPRRIELPVVSGIYIYIYVRNRSPPAPPFYRFPNQVYTAVTRDFWNTITLLSTLDSFKFFFVFSRVGLVLDPYPRTRSCFVYRGRSVVYTTSLVSYYSVSPVSDGFCRIYIYICTGVWFRR